jgi:tetratricopeptide (TPR) repeat protein
MYPEAIARAEQAVEQFDRTPRLLVAQAEAYAASGRRPEAEEVLAELQAAAENRYVDPILLAIVQTALGNRDAAFDELERAYENRSPWLSLIKIDPQLDPLRGDPRFDDLLRRMGLTPGQLARQGQAA